MIVLVLLVVLGLAVWTRPKTLLDVLLCCLMTGSMATLGYLVGSRRCPPE